MNTKRRLFRKSIFSKLIGSFILFAVAIAVTFALCLLLEMTFIGGGDIGKLTPDAIIDEYGNVTDIETVGMLGGWIEELDENDNILRVYGDKKTAVLHYDTDELLRLTSMYSDYEFVGIYVAPESSERRFLCVYDRRMVQPTMNVILNNIPSHGQPDFIMLFIPLSIAEIVLISLYHRRKIKRPLDSIIAGMESLKSGNSSARIDIRTEAEFEEIVETFNIMADRLEREKTEKERLTQSKNRMLLELSHDIRTPVATIKSCANALEAGLVPEERIQSYYRTIDAKADRVRILSDDMFTMLKMDTPDYTLNLERTNMCEFLRRLCAEYYDEVTKAGFEFIVDIPENDIFTEIDVKMFPRVVGNLLSNAVRYNDTGSTISARLAEGKMLTLEIADDGQPIALAEEVFTAFSRGDKARRTDGGTGLGLAISKLIVEKHGGKLGYFREGKENVFRVKLNIH